MTARTIKYAGNLYHLAGEETYQGKVKYSFPHWSFVLADREVKSLVDDLQITAAGAPTIFQQDGLLAFLGRIMLSDHIEDQKARSELLTLLASETLVREAFTNTIQKLRNNETALMRLMRCLTIGVGAKPDTKRRLRHLPEQVLQSLLDRLVSESGRYFDFSSIDGFLDSFEILPAEVVSPEIRG